jgi:hypothetical protein
MCSSWQGGDVNVTTVSVIAGQNGSQKEKRYSAKLTAPIVTRIGIPRIMEGTLPSHFQPNKEDDPIMKACKQFISNAR